MRRDDPVSAVFDALADQRRRRILFELADDESVSEATLTSAIAVDDPDRVAIELRHTHLPKLADYGFVVWDREGARVSRGPGWETLAPVLGFVRE